MAKINYAFSEDRVIRDLQKYVDGTYDQHYAQRKYQGHTVHRRLWPW